MTKPTKQSPTHNEQQSFLNSLKTGDKVAVRSRRIDTRWHFWGYQIFEVLDITKNVNSQLKFKLRSPDGGEWHFDRTGYGCKGTGYFVMEQLSKEVYKSIEEDNIKLQAIERKWVVINKLHEVDDTFPTMNTKLHKEFIKLTDGLLKFLDVHTKPDVSD